MNEVQLHAENVRQAAAKISAAKTEARRHPPKLPGLEAEVGELLDHDGPFRGHSAGASRAMRFGSKT